MTEPEGPSSGLDRPTESNIPEATGADRHDPGLDSAPHTMPLRSPEPTISTAPVAHTGRAVLDVEGAPLPTVPGYEILGLLGHGGMGVVYKARDLNLQRTVALKMVLAGGLARPEELVRFKSEAQAVARLQHPNIVQIFEVGEHQGAPFCALEYLEGGSLARKIAEQPLSPRAAAALVQTLARAMHLAHSRNVVHRDLKPGNVLLTTDGVPKVGDFGLARQTDADSGQTHTGAVMGTPSFMAPELASGQGHDAGPAADVHGLGAILYACLTGQAPFKADSVPQTLDLVRFHDPVRPSALRPGLPRDLETVCLKCLRKEPEQRYASAQELAEDLGRFLEGVPVLARPAGPAERVWRWARRRPVEAALAVGLLLLGALGLAGVLWQWRQAEEARAEAVLRAEAEAGANLKTQAARRDTERALADTCTSFGILAGSRDEAAEAVLWFANAARWAGPGTAREGANRVRAAAWGVQAFRPVAALPHDSDWLAGMEFHPAGKHLLTQTITPDFAPGSWVLWDIPREAAIPLPGKLSQVSCATWSPDGHVLALGTLRGELGLFRFPSGEALHQEALGSPVRALGFSPGGELLAVGGDGGVRVWDCQQARFAGPLLPHTRAVTQVLFNASVTRLATASEDGRARVFAAPFDSPTPLYPPVPHIHRVRRDRGVRVIPLVFVNGGCELLTNAGGGALSWRDADTGAELLTPPPHFPSYITALAVSPAGDYLAVCGAGAPTPEGKYEPVASSSAWTQLWNVAERRETVPPARLPHRDRAYMLSLSFSPAGDLLFSGCTDGTARLWAVPTGTPASPPLLHPTHVHQTAFSPDGRLVATAQRGGLVRLWALPGPVLPRVEVPYGGGGSFARLSPDGKYVLPAGMTYQSCCLRAPRVHDLASGQPAGPPLSGDTVVLDAAFSPDGGTVVLARSNARRPSERTDQQPATRGGRLQFWDWRAGKQSGEPVVLSRGEPRSVSFAPDGTRVAAVGADGELLLVDAASHRALWRQQAHAGRFTNGAWVNNGSVRFSPDGLDLLTWGTDAELRVWEAAGGKRRLALEHQALCCDLDFAPDRRRLATAGRDSAVRFWQWPTGAADDCGPLLHPDWVHSVRFSPDGRYVLTGCRDSRARLWDSRDGRLLWVAPHEHEVHAVAFSGDGRRVLTACDDRTLRFWDTASGSPLAPPLPVSGVGLNIALTPAGDRVVVGGFCETLDVFRLGALRADDTLTTADLCLWAELLSGQRVHESGGTTMLTDAEWLARWREFRSRHSAPGNETPGS